MGKRPKSSRKGKKAWRANISTEDFEDYFEKSTKDALSGGSLADAPSDSLFFVDKSRGIIKTSICRLLCLTYADVMKRTRRNLLEIGIVLILLNAWQVFLF